MVEPLLHVVVPFASLRAVSVDWRKSAFAAVVALAPDLDVLFHVHRSQSHSVIMLAAVALPLLILTRNQKTARTLVLLGTFGVLVHLALDVFQSSTPLFWPLLSQSPWISTTLSFHIGSMPFVTGSAELLTAQTAIEPFTSFDEPILTAPGLAISLVLLTPDLIQILRSTLAPVSPGRRRQTAS